MKTASIRTLRITRALGLSLATVSLALSSTLLPASVGLKVAAQTFGVLPEVGAEIGRRHETVVVEVHSDLQSTIFLFEQDGKRFCLMTTHLGGPYRGQLREICVDMIGKALKIERHAIVICGSHNHCVAPCRIDAPNDPTDEPAIKSHRLYQQFVSKLQQSLEAFPGKLEPATVAWGVAEETRITYNRKGRYLDGRSYLIREEDRLKLGEGYTGLIDPTASVVAFKRNDGSVIACLTFFTGHPVTAYHPERQIVFGEWPQVACEKLSKHFGGVPVGFIQGCAGDINSKHMLAGSVQRSREFGGYLGDAFIIAANSLRPSKRTDLEWRRGRVDLPLAPLPSAADLQKDLTELDDFVKRGKAGDENTLYCVGMNFPLALSAPFRARTAEAVRPWYVWALEQHRLGKANQVLTELPLQIVVARFGDVGFVGLPWEAFVATGLKIKGANKLPHVLTAGYTDGHYGYIPDASGCDDREYMSGNYRYQTQRMGMVGRLPFKSPGGDAAADVAIKILADLAQK